MRINTIQVGLSINGASILFDLGQGKYTKYPGQFLYFISAVGEHRVLLSTLLLFYKVKIISI